MAQRRLFSPAIVGSDAFLEMPVSSRELYFQLGMYADDDGFINPKKIMRMVGAGDDDLKVILAKRFALPFESGVIVIKHWLIHNTIRRDRYKETVYLDEKSKIFIKENGAYTDMATSGKPIGNQMAPQVKLSEGKVSKVKLSKTNTSAASVGLNPIIKLFEGVNPSYDLLFKRPPQRAALERLLEKNGEEKLKQIIAVLPFSNKDQFAPTITTPIQLEEKLGQLLAWYQKKKSKGQNTKIATMQ